MMSSEQLSELFCQMGECQLLEMLRMPVAFFPIRSMKKKTKRKCNPLFLAGNLLKNKNQAKLKASEARRSLEMRGIFQTHR
jgi:hypothetical protein